MNPQNIVRLTVNGADFSGWKKVSITAGLDRAARDFDLDVTSKWPAQGVADIPRRIRPGDVCRVYIGNDLVLTGYVDATPIRYDGKSVSVGVKGRSKTADLVDCAAINEPGQWMNREPIHIASDMAAPYGVKVISQAKAKPVPDHQIDTGETVFESIDRMLPLRALLATDDSHGNLVLTGVGTGRCATALELGKNILSGNAGLDWKDRFRDYVTKGQAAGTDQNYASALAVKALATDAAVGRKRIKIVKQAGELDDATALLLAKWMSASAAGKSLKTTYTVAGWRQSDGSLWLPNHLVRVRDSLIGFDTDMLIGEVTWSLDESGTITQLTVAPPSAWELKPDTTQGGAA